MRPDRRKFIKDTLCCALGGASVYSALGQLQLVQAAVRSNYSFTDYKALVCVFMYGGNDSFNTVVPYTTGAFNSFYGASGVRPQLALTQSQFAQAQCADHRRRRRQPQHDLGRHERVRLASRACRR